MQARVLGPRAVHRAAALHDVREGAVSDLMTRKITMIGEVVCDMHGRSLRSHERLNAAFAVRNIIEFPLSDADSKHAGVVSQSRHIEQWFSKLTIGAGQGIYGNKYLICIGETTRDGWAPCGYLYDGRRVGFCEVMAHADALHNALVR
jgi:hypothetical protein